jgi:hypothetical protein
LFERLTNEKKWRKMLEQEKAAAGADAAEDKEEAEPDVEGGSSEAGAEGKPKGKKDNALPEHFTPERARTFWYADPDNADAFREWLQAVVATRPLRKVLETGYGKSPIAQAGGLMTFRYFTLCTRNGENTDKSVSTHEALQKYDQENCFIDYFVRNESLADDMVKALEGCGVAIDDSQKKQIHEAKKTNVSTRPHGPEYYYDKASTMLVARRERFIIEKFSYKNAKP